MRVLVIGAGLLGVSSAWYLARAGHQVTVVEQAVRPGMGASFANGALLTPSMSEPWNAPGSWKVLLGSLTQKDAPLQLLFPVIPHLARWGSEFLWNSLPIKFDKNAENNRRLALYSRNTLKKLREETGIEFGWRECGALRIFRESRAFNSALRSAEVLSKKGMRARELSLHDLRQREPTLSALGAELKGAIFYECDESGDAYAYCQELARICCGKGVQFHYSTKITDIKVESGHVKQVLTSIGSFSADRYVLAAGAYSSSLLKRLGVRLPVEPAKGYSVTFDKVPDQFQLKTPIIDDTLHAALVPLENSIRVAGTAEFSGFDATIVQARAENLVSLMRRIFPTGKFDIAEARIWCGLRPMSADGSPFLGRTKISNLFVNAGHGHLGWTMAAGSGKLLADLVSENKPDLDPGPYRADRSMWH